MFLFSSYELKWRGPLSPFSQDWVPNLWGLCPNLIPSPPIFTRDTQVLFLLCIPKPASPSKPGQGRVKHPSNPQQGPPHRLGNNGAISLYLTFAPTAFMTYSSPPQPAVIQPSISHPLPELCWPSPNTLSASQVSVLPHFSPSFLMSPRFLSVLFPILLYFLPPLSPSSCSPTQLPFPISFLPLLSFLLLSALSSPYHTNVAVGMLGLDEGFWKISACPLLPL